MPAAPQTARAAAIKKSQRGTEESALVKWLLISIALAFCLVFLVLPLINVFAQALAKGWDYYWASLIHPDSWSAMRLTLIVAAIAVRTRSRPKAEEATEPWAASTANTSPGCEAYPLKGNAGRTSASLRAVVA